MSTPLASPPRPSPASTGLRPRSLALPFVATIAPLLAITTLACHRDAGSNGAPAQTSASAASAAPSASSSVVTSASASASAPSASASAGPTFAIVEELSRTVGPRLSCSPGDAAGVDWAEAKMKALGLSNVHREKVMVPCWSRGDAAASFSAGGKPFESLAIAALGGSVPTKGELVAPVVEVASLDALEKLPAGALAGKIAFLSARTERRADGKGYGQAVGGRWRGPSAAAKKGAIAFMLRSVSTADDDAPHTGQMKYFDDAPKVAAVALGPKSADRLHEALGRGEVRVKLMSLTDHAPDAASANVVGEVPGSANPAEIVVLGAHLDSWDLGRGAQDDGAGVAVVLETAHRLVPRAGDPALRRTVRVVLYANEENGTRGASAYVEAHRDELARHVAAVECDEGAGSIAAIRWVGDPLDLPVIDGLSGAAAALGVARPTIGEHAGTDVSAMAAAGVPLLDLSQDALAYFDVHHAPTDVPASIDRAGLERAADQYTAFVRALAGDRTPLRRWKPPAEKH